MPSPRGHRASTFQIARKRRSELDRLASDRLVADLDPPLGQQIFDVPKAHREPEIEPYGLTNDVSWKPVPLVGNRSQRCLLGMAMPISGDKLALA